MLDKITGIEERYEELNQLLMEVGDDYQRAAELGIERAELEPLVTKSRQYRQAIKQMEDARSLENTDDDEIRELAAAEIEQLEPEIEGLELEIKSMLLPQDARDNRNVIMEVRAGTGGDEAALFAADLFRMYSRFAEIQRWKMEILSANEIGIGGFKEVAFLIKGRGAYSRLKYESGVHRVQRVPITESQVGSIPLQLRWLCWQKSMMSKSISQKVLSGSMFTNPPGQAVRAFKKMPQQYALPIYRPGSSCNARMNVPSSRIRLVP